MTWYPLQQRFSYGEIGRAFYSQQESPIYEAGLAECYNAYPTPQGEVRTRAGLAYDYTVQTDYSGDGRVFALDMNADDRVICTMSNGQLKLHTGASFVRQGNFVENWDFSDAGAGWTVYEGSSHSVYWFRDHSPLDVDYEDPNWIGGYMYGYLYDKGNSYRGRVWLRKKIPVTAVDGGVTIKYYVYNTIEDLAGQTFTVRMGKGAYGQTDLYNAVHAVTNGSIVEVSAHVPGMDGYTGDVYLEMGATLNNGYDNGKYNYLVNYVGLFFDQPPLAEIPPLTIPYADEELEDVQYVQNPYVNTGNHDTQAMMVFAHPNHTPQELVLDAVGDWIFRPITFTAEGNTKATPDWIESPEAGDFPRACGAHQGRLLLGGTKSEPQSVWASRPGNWYDVFQPDVPTAATPIWYTMTAIGAIQWILGFRTLLHGTANGEHTISAQSVLIQSGDIQVNEQSRYGSAHIQATLVGDEAFYVGGDKRKIRKINWEDDQQSWRSMDLTFTAPHIASGKIDKIAFSKDPQQVLWAPLKNGTVIGMSYEPGLDIHGWHKHETDGVVVDVAEARFGGRDYVMMLVRRHINGQDNLYLESMTTRPNLQSPHLDSYVWSQSADQRTVVTGLDHLEDQTVTAIANGKESEYLVASGQITLDEPAADVVVGLPYTTRITTLPSRPTPKVGSQGSKKNWSRIGLRLNGSGRPIVNGVRYKPKPGAEDNGLVTGDYHQHHFGWDDWAQITIEQDKSDPLILTGIFGKLTDEEL
jgi:hypothetical protein